MIFFSADHGIQKPVSNRGLAHVTNAELTGDKRGICLKRYDLGNLSLSN